MVNVVKGDYAILAGEKNKTYFIKVTGEADNSGGMYRGVVVDETAAKPATRQTFSFEPSDILANLGPRPKIGGNVYGKKIEPFRKMLQHPDWGDVILFRNLEQMEEQMLMRHLTTVAKKLKDLGVFPYRKETQVHIRPASGKYAGFYTHNTKEHDVLTYKAVSFDHENMDYYISHEYGHAMWFTMMPPQWRSQWIKFYIKNTQKLMTGSQRIASLMSEYIESELTIREFGRALEADVDKKVLSEILTTIRKVHALEPRHIDELRAMSSESVAGVWPKNAVELPQHQILVSDYANKNPDEFWCEAFSFWFIGKQIPPGLEAAVKKTIAACRLDARQLAA